MKIDFYKKITEKVSELYQESPSRHYILKTLNKDFLDFLNKNNYKIVDDGKEHKYFGTALFFGDYQVVYVKDRLDKKISKLLLNDKDDIIEISNYSDEVKQNDEVVASSKSSIYLNGELKHMVLSVYNKTAFCDEMIYESVMSFNDRVDSDKKSHEVIEVQYFLGEPLNGKYNNTLIGNSTIEEYIELANLRLEYIYNFFDKFDIKHVRVKKHNK